MNDTIAHPPRPNCPALIICQKIQATPQRLINIGGMMNAFSTTEFPASSLSVKCSWNGSELLSA